MPISVLATRIAPPPPPPPPPPLLLGVPQKPVPHSPSGACAKAGPARRTSVSPRTVEATKMAFLMETSPFVAHPALRGRTQGQSLFILAQGLCVKILFFSAV